jgi:adenosylcobyric acid synthase
MHGKFRKVQGVLAALSGKEFHGYEIHSGVTNFPEGKALTTVEPIHEKAKPMAEGSQNVNDVLNVYGTYIHGIFDGEGIAATVVEALLKKKGLSPDDVKVIDYATYKEQQYDLLAEQMRKHLDMKKIYAILEAGI